MGCLDRIIPMQMMPLRKTTTFQMLRSLMENGARYIYAPEIAIFEVDPRVTRGLMAAAYKSGESVASFLSEEVIVKPWYAMCTDCELALGYIR